MKNNKKGSEGELNHELALSLNNLALHGKESKELLNPLQHLKLTTKLKQIIHDCCQIKKILYSTSESSEVQENTNLGDFIKHLRTQRRLSQCKFAELLNVTQATVSRWENSEKK